MAEKTSTSFGPVQIGWIALAIVIFFLFQNYAASLRNERIRKHREALQAQAEREAEEAARLKAAKKAGAAKGEQRNPTLTNAGGNGRDPNPGGSTRNDGEHEPPTLKPEDSPKTTAQAEPPQEKAEVPPSDIIVETDSLKLKFTHRGAALRDATLSDEYLTIAKTDQLELLAEIIPGERTLGIPKFTWGTFSPVSLENRLWTLKSDSGGFSGENETRTLVFELPVAFGDGQEICRLTRTYRIPKVGHYLDHDLRIMNLGKKAQTYSFSVRGAHGILLDGPPENPRQGQYVFLKADLAGRGADTEEPQTRVLYGSSIESMDSEARTLSAPMNIWAGVGNRFFTAVLVARSPSEMSASEALPVNFKPDVGMLIRRATELAQKQFPDLAEDQGSLRGLALAQGVLVFEASAAWRAKLAGVEERSALLAAIREEGIPAQEILVRELNDKRFLEPNLGVVFHRATYEGPGASGGVLPGESSPGDAFALYLGPLKYASFAQFERQAGIPAENTLYLDNAVQYVDIGGWRWYWLNKLGVLFLWMFELIHAVLGNWGLAVILLTIAVRAGLHPLQRKMMVSFHKIQELAPQVAAINKKYENQTSSEMSQKKQMEIMDLYRKHGVNPMGGCLPMLIQMPIMITLYGVFNRAYDLRQAEFLWVQDLTLPDRAFDIYGMPINLLPIIYMGLTMWTMFSQPAPANQTPEQAMQRKMMMFMPLMFFFIIYAMPAGLVLYFAISAIFSLAENWYIKKYILKVDANTAMALPAGI